jgi:integrase
MKLYLIDGCKVLYARHGVRKVTTGIRIDPKYWDIESQRMDPNYIHAKDVNQAIEDFVAKFEKTGVLKSNKVYRSRPIAEKSNSFYQKFSEYIDTEIKPRVTRESTVSSYKSILSLIEQHEAIDMHDLIAKLRAGDKKYYSSYFNSIVQRANNYLKWTGDTKLIGSKYKNVRADRVALTQEELHLIENCQTRHYLIRDLFLVQCYTGISYADLCLLKKSNFKNGMLVYNRMKTGILAQIPLHPSVAKIVNKYDGILPNVPILQTYNNTIREIGKECKIDTVVLIDESTTKGREQMEYNKYELLSSHCGRTTFVTMCNDNGLKPSEIKVFTGHSSVANVYVYTKQDQVEATTKLTNIWKW